jgi:hypothetical protein
MSSANALSDREAVIDAATRFVLALDDADMDLLQSSMTEDMVMDLTPFNPAGFDYKPMHGRDTIAIALMKVVGTGMDTTHHISNFRIDVNGDEASFRCYVLAQHFRKGHGMGETFTDYYLMGNKYKGAARYP